MRIIIPLFIVVLLLSLFTGFGLGQSDVLNPMTSAAKVQRMSVETDLLRIEREYAEKLQKLELAQKELELQNNLQNSQRNNEFREFTTLILLALVAICALLLCGGTSYYLICRGNALQSARG